MENELLFEIEAELAPPIVIPDTPEGTRVVVHITGGKFDGPRLKGAVLASGADWFLVRPDGIGVIDVRIVLKTDDGENIYLTYTGRTKMAGGRPTALYTAPTFSASVKGKYAWLNGVQAVGVGAAGDSGAMVRYKLYAPK